MPYIYDMEQTALLALRRKACWEFFRPEKSSSSVGFEPANLGTKGQHATCRPPKPLWPVWFYHIFLRNLIKGTIFGGKFFFEHEYVFWFSVQLLSKSFLHSKNTARYYHQRTQVFLPSTRYCQILMTIAYSRHVLEDSSKVKFKENTSHGSRVVPRGRTDRQIWRS